ncbi:hypothetical protein Ade02nite_79770 [Paractinoplanes deccanensis]|uniref:DUF389 domain-containing protein n=1 Tax=Paractinoplanes deccanensis TaxID=113561 RepID=A0ABQ3YH62_9ACTN|nr:DUF389 domain-containing protein [Actinoplanes deccanensis]GID79336.1 hypothetical protein Ade02nite_79770 [Actinoplanes deccanensis]
MAGGAWPGIRASAADVERITARLFLTRGDPRRNLTTFGVLLTLAAVIAAAGVVADSTATVIGAMIVAPLMTPILGTALAIVLADRRQILVNLGLVLAGTAAVVAIAISLVPPLAVVGLTLESGAYGESFGALLLFGTNVAAIIATGLAIMLGARLRDAAGEAGLRVGALGARTVATVVLSLVLVAAPLAYGSWQALQEQIILSRAEPVAGRWAAEQGWQLTDIRVERGTLRVVAMGPLPEASRPALRQQLDDAGLDGVDAVVTLVVGGSRTLTAD